MTLQLSIATHSEVGLVRKNNQDSGYASPHLLVVADGMGGAAAGDLASAVAVDTIRSVDAHTEGDQMLAVLAGALHRANDRIADLVEEDYALEGMGTTVTGALFDGTQLGLAHIGDSRAYLLRDSRLERLTHDHSWVQSLVDTGKINEDEAAVHPHRSLLLKVLNGQPANHPDLTLVRLEAGDRLLLCSDGLCGLVDDDVIEAALRTPDQDAALKRLVKAALAEGGIDNITVILADVVDSSAVSTTSTRPVVLGAALERDIPPVETRTRGAELPAASSPDEPEPGDHASGPTDAQPAAVATVPSGDDDEARYSPQPPRSHPRRHSWGALILAVVVVGAALASAYAWTRTQFFVAASGNQVAIFQGLDESLPGVRLSRLFEVQPLEVSALPLYYQERVRASIDVASLSAARQTVSELDAAARRCAQPAPGATPRAVPQPVPLPSVSGGASPSTSARPTSSARPSISALPTASARVTTTARPPASTRPSGAARATPGSVTSADSATPRPDC